MTFIVYPATLPGPSVSGVTPAERRLLSDVTGGPQQARGVQRDYLGTQRVEWGLLDATQAAAFDAWWKTSLSYGGAWFASTWPAPQGWVSLVRRFMGAPQWVHLPNGFWRVSAQMQVRGRGMPPIVEEVVAWDPAREQGAWTLASLNRTAISSSGGGATNNISATAARANGKRYFECVFGYVTAWGSLVRHDVGISTSGPAASGSSVVNSGAGYRRSGQVMQNSTSIATPALVSGDVVMIAADLDVGSIWFGVNGTWTLSGNPGTGANAAFTGLAAGTYYIGATYESGADINVAVRGEHRLLSYSIPSGFTTWGF